MGAGSSLGKMDPVAFGDALLVNVEGEKVGPANEHYTKLYEVNISQSDGQTYSIYPADISEYSKGGTLEVMVPIITGPFYGMVHRAGIFNAVLFCPGFKCCGRIKCVQHNQQCI